MKKIYRVVFLACCVAVFGSGCSSGSTTESVQEATTQMATEDTRHIHKWTNMEDSSESWEECESCGAKKNIKEITTEATIIA